MALHGYKPGELFWRTMLTAADPSRNEGNSLAAGKKHSPADVIVQSIGEILDQKGRLKRQSNGNEIAMDTRNR